MSKVKSRIDTYETIYPVHLVVANKYTTIEELKELYTYADYTELDESVLDGMCTVCMCRRKSDDRCVSLVKYNYSTTIKGVDPKRDMIETYSHEACHVVLDIYNFIGDQVDLKNQETFAYFVGWVAGCIFNTLNR